MKILASLREMLRPIWGSVAFRLTLNYSLFSLGTSLLLLFLFYFQALAIVEAQFSRHVSTTAQRMAAYFDKDGLDGVKHEIDLELADLVNTDTEIFLLVDTEGRFLAGNIEPDPALLRLDGMGIKHTVVLRNAPANGYVYVRVLPDDSRLVVGYDLRYLDEIRRLVQGVTLMALLVMMVLVIAGAYMFRRILQRRIEIIRQTARQIGAGQISRRVPVTGHEDEFARLTHDINAMLDQIEALMTGARNVADAVAHHLRTPLTRIMARIRTLRRGDVSHETLKAGFDWLALEMEELAKIAGKLLQISELESGIRRMRFEPVRLDEVARDVVDLYEVVAEDSGSSLDFVAGTPVVVYGDRDLLAGAVMNLVDNALKYAGNKALIQVEVGHRGSAAWIWVTDDGPGIPVDKQPRIGERFYRLSDQVPGHGLGLATVIAIAHLHGAKFELRNQGGGLQVGLCFTSVDTHIAES